jgi:hypothetical protein
MTTTARPASSATQIHADHTVPKHTHKLAGRDRAGAGQDA